MVQQSNVAPLSSTPLSSSDDNTFNDVIDSSTHPKSPSSSSSSKRTRGRPVGSKNKPKLTLVIDQDNKHTQKPIFIQIPKNSDVIKALIQFSYDYQSSITVHSASGSIRNVTLRDNESITSAFIVHGPFTLVSLIGTCINNNSCTISSLSNLDIGCFFNISFCSNIGQSFIGVVGGKVIADDDVIVAVTVFNNSENNKGENQL
ncbi:AT-hook motif nuclear-localized protein 17-like [Vigna radiata var. radiata]|uniref:AT-hook motif nuclear-localized protein 17-like n=1 Tax=Vigna radiata var. radiata TaxID=3916 RepID=A0A1S3UA80_VIGRR|nr:AT-hook motif nuclear-localized protein 17-like [Vigna radiata var. radiata]